jgi:glutamyl-Q tRNA(Asp) synthetase
MPVTRFAPSPTGRLHLGHAFSARICRELSAGAPFLLRFEDIDHTRVREEFYDGISEDLRWLGIEWDGEPLRQSDRRDAYAGALAKLRELGAVYPCFCSRRDIQAELAAMPAAPHGPEGPHYPGNCRGLDPEVARARTAAGETPSWRLDTTRAASLAGPLHFDDEIHGRLPVDPTLLGDLILARKDIGTSYHLAVVVDDAFQQIELVTRGEDLLPSTHVHRLLQALLGLPEPRYHHHRLIRDENGERLAKRHDSLAIATLRKQGLTPAEVWRQIDCSGGL